VTRAFDKAGRLEQVTDWSANVTKFTYNADSEQMTTLFPSATKDEDKYAYNEADQMTEAKVLKRTRPAQQAVSGIHAIEARLELALTPDGRIACV
jgi:hypothetical protein